MDLCSTRGNNHLSFPAEQVKIAIFIKPTHVTRRHPIMVDECFFCLSFDAFEISRCNAVFANRNDLAISSQLDSDSGEQPPHGTNSLCSRNVECNTTKLDHAVRLEQRQLHELKKIQG